MRSPSTTMPAPPAPPRRSFSSTRTSSTPSPRHARSRRPSPRSRVSRWPSRGAARCVRPTDRRGRRQPAARPGLRHQRLRRARAVRPRVVRAGYTAGARHVDVLYVDEGVRKTVVESGTEDDLGYTPPWLVERRKAYDGHGYLLLRGHPDPTMFDDVDGERLARSRRQEEDAVWLRQVSDRRVNWSLVVVPDRRLGADRLRRAGRRPALGSGAPDRATGRGRPGRCLAGAHRPARSALRAHERAALRHTPVPRAGHRPDGRAAPGLGLAGREGRRPRGARSTSRTYRARRSTRRRTPAGPRDTSARRCRSSFRAGS